MPQQHGIQATSLIYTIAHGNTGSLTHWVRPGIKPASSWILVGFVSAAPQWELDFCQNSWCYPGPETYVNLYFPRIDKNENDIFGSIQLISPDANKEILKNIYIYMNLLIVQNWLISCRTRKSNFLELSLSTRWNQLYLCQNLSHYSIFYIILNFCRSEQQKTSKCAHSITPDNPQTSTPPTYNLLPISKSLSNFPDSLKSKYFVIPGGL